MTPAPARILPDVLVRRDPVAPAAPVVFDSPHSGNVYPADFGHAAPLHVLRRAEDAFVDELFAAAPAHGAGLLAALFPRSYVDPNRHEHEVDERLLADQWPHDIQRTHRSARGLGVVRRLVRATVPVYERRLPAAEIAARIARYHRPYHDELAAMLDAAHARFGVVWHVNCHSMKSSNRGHARADFVLGDRDGTTCDAGFTEVVAAKLRDLGYRVDINHPFKGAEIVIRHGAPGRNRHSLQLEINRGLYMNEETIEVSAGFAALRADIDRLIAAVVAHSRREAPVK